jgi:hypothetical protein
MAETNGHANCSQNVAKANSKEEHQPAADSNSQWMKQNCEITIEGYI